MMNFINIDDNLINLEKVEYIIPNASSLYIEIGFTNDAVRFKYDDLDELISDFGVLNNYNQNNGQVFKGHKEGVTL